MGPELTLDFITIAAFTAALGGYLLHKANQQVYLKSRNAGFGIYIYGGALPIIVFSAVTLNYAVAAFAWYLPFATLMVAEASRIETAKINTFPKNR